MIRKLLATSAMALMVAAPAIAQDNAAQPAATTTQAPAGDMLSGGYMHNDGDWLMSRVLGQPVYTSAAADAETIGDINDFVLNPDGQLGAVIIGVGGFLGMGEKNVAVELSQLQLVAAADNTERWVLETTKEALNAAPAFEWQDDQQNMQTAATNPNAMQPAPDATAPANAPAPATDVAATPAPNPNDPNANAMGSGMSTAQETAATPAAADPNAPMTFSQEGMNPVDLGTITADQLIGTKVIGPENNEIAEVGDIVLTDDGKIDALLVDFGGFLGIGEKRVAVGVDNLQFLTDQNGAQYVWLNVTKEQLDAAAAYDENTYKDTRDAQRLVISQS